MAAALLPPDTPLPGSTPPPAPLAHVPSSVIHFDAGDVARMGLRKAMSWTHQTAEFAAKAAEHAPRSVKRVLFVRHGEGIHNEAERVLGKHRWETHEAMQPKYFDPSLNAVGRTQAETLGGALTPELASGSLAIDLIVVSPLVRAIETAELALAHVWRTVPVVAVEMARERHGKNICDMRRRTSELSALYPHIDFERFMLAEEDPWHRPDSRETPESVRARAEALMHWILALPPTVKTVAVVGHSDYMSHAVEVAGFEPHWPSNGEMVPMMITHRS